MKKSLYVVKYKERTIIISRDFAKARGISKKRLKKIRKLHKKRLKIIDRMEKADPKTDKVFLREMLQKLIKLDLKVQKLWNFEKSLSHLQWWRQVPHCNCPNPTFYGVSPSCPVHGFF